jgi:hypothetical protein
MKYLLAIIGFFQVLTGLAILLGVAVLVALAIFVGIETGSPLAGFSVFWLGAVGFGVMLTVGSLFTRLLP